ncbi:MULTISPECIES: hypothetical protein [Clostridium]|uniref:Uncharacterized protein n=1 Tax=Clostridium cibarium TaxID=2762247 RepID=A0ABR8PS17_9CLOT|nr:MULTISPECIES: hypothetical protein [Clostridium]MBD7910914.1 hypothetical protein [Clostridium cibarium]
MEDTNLKMAQQDINDALETVKDLEKVANEENLSKELLREKFVTLNEKVKNLENILKNEGII